MSFGLSIGYNALASIAKQFLLDIVRPSVGREAHVDSYGGTNSERIYNPRHRRSSASVMIKWVSRLRCWISRMWPTHRIAADAEWQKIAWLGVIRNSGFNQVSIKPDRRYRNIKLRSIATDLDVHRWSLEFHDGTVLDLSVNGLMKGTESKPMAIGGRRLKRVVVQYDASRVARRGRLEIWAQA